MTSRIVAIAVAFVVSLGVREARADITASFQIKVPDQKDPKQADKAPSIEVTIINGPKTTLDKFSLSTTNQGQRVTVKAEKLKEYIEGTETIAIALVINGQEIWIGNDKVETDPNAAFPGILESLEAAIDKAQFGSAGPPGSKGVVISYSTSAVVKVPMGDLKLITGAALGGQRDYQRKIGTDMVQGITLALSELSRVSTARKALIVIGDGSDTNHEAAKSALADLKKQAAKDNIQLFAVISKSQISPEDSVITTMIPNAKLINSIDGIGPELGSIIQRIGDRYYVDFPGYDEKTGTGLPWDGKDHDLVVKIDQTELDAASQTLAPKWELAKHGAPWLAIILTVFGIIFLVILIKLMTRKKEEPMPMMMAPPPMMAAEPPKPMGPSKTVMIGAGGDQEGFPIVGWLVPLNGVNAYQTWRLRPGLTKIGTAPPSDIVVNDGFMSTEHCSITSSPAGFTLLDAGSTNGCYVNDRKVQKADLIDNDVIMLGKTNLKFKSIN